MQFPPADQVQSLGLRAALLRALEQAKKSGALGRDMIVRKTMLDECRGERLEEVLAVFSSVVLKKVVSCEGHKRPRDHPAAAKKLALESRDYAAERTPLYALILAHRVSLDRGLCDKEAARARYRDFALLLDQKQHGIARRREELRALRDADKAEPLGDDAQLGIWQTVRNNWSGSAQWLDALLSGSGNSADDARTHPDGLLTTPYDRVWRRVQAGRLVELEGHGHHSLLEQLDKRVRGQHKQLQRWREYRRSVFARQTLHTEDGPAKTAAAPAKRGIDLGFGAHKALLPVTSTMSPKKARDTRTAPLADEYADLVAGLEAELARINQTQPRSQSTLVAFLRTRTTRPADTLPTEPEAQDTVSDISDMEDVRPEPPLRTSSSRALLTKKSLTFLARKASMPNEEDEEEELQVGQVASHKSTLDAPIRRRASPPIWPRHSHKAASMEESQLISTSTRSRPQTPPQPPIPTVPDIAVQQLQDERASMCRSPSPTQQMADQILASMSNASPSPVKKPRHTLSLAERTRLSMAHLRPQAPEEDESVLETPVPVRRNTTPATSHLGVLDADEGPSTTHDDLVERTRKSLAGFEASRQKAQLERRRSQRRAKHPPRSHSISASPFATVDEADDTLVLAEELMSGEQDDAEAIFRSRPKIKMSPLPSPTREFEEDY